MSIVSFDSLSFSGLEWTLYLLPSEQTGNSVWYGRLSPVNSQTTVWCHGVVNVNAVNF